MSWHDRFKAMKKNLGYTNKDIAEITDLIFFFPTTHTLKNNYGKF